MNRPRRFMLSLTKRGGPIALKWMVASLQPSLEALLPIGIPWQDVQVELLRCDMTAFEKRPSGATSLVGFTDPTDRPTCSQICHTAGETCAPDPCRKGRELERH